MREMTPQSGASEALEYMAELLTKGLSCITASLASLFSLHLMGLL